MPKPTVKVSGLISTAQHARIAALASRHQTTIGAIVTAAVVRALKDLEAGDDSFKPKRDKRRNGKGVY